MPNVKRDVAKVKALLKEAKVGADFEVEVLARRGEEPEMQPIQDQLTTAGIRPRSRSLRVARARRARARRRLMIVLSGVSMCRTSRGTTIQPSMAATRPRWPINGAVRTRPGMQQRIRRLMAEAAKIQELRSATSFTPKRCAFSMTRFPTSPRVRAALLHPPTEGDGIYE